MSEQRRKRQAEVAYAEETPAILRRLAIGFRNNWKKFLFLGAPGALDLIKEFIRGKVVDQAYMKLGDLGRWLYAYPAAFFTLGLGIVILAIIVITIKESIVNEDSSLTDEHGVPYRRPPAISRKWTVSVVVAGLICVGIISYGTYRYYQISKGNFIVNGGATIFLPVLPLAPPAPIPPNPPSLLDVFGSDFPELFRARNDLSLEGTTVSLKQQLYLDFRAKSVFVGFYIPALNSREETTSKICMLLSDQAKDAITGFSKDHRMLSAFGDQGTSLEDLTFTRRVLIYYEDFLSITQKAEIIDTYKRKKLDVQFTGEDYLGYQINLWQQKLKAQQGH